jgi:hypothetical protein
MLPNYELELEFARDVEQLNGSASTALRRLQQTDSPLYNSRTRVKWECRQVLIHLS